MISCAFAFSLNHIFFPIYCIFQALQGALERVNTDFFATSKQEGMGYSMNFNDMPSIWLLWMMPHLPSSPPRSLLPHRNPHLCRPGTLGLSVLILLRLLQGVCTGGEIAAVTTYLTEIGEPRDPADFSPRWSDRCLRKRERRGAGVW